VLAADQVVAPTDCGAIGPAFASAVDAARCALEIQRDMARNNADTPQDKRIEFRNGVHVGDIIFDENDILGEGVNIAARFEGIADSGGVRARKSCPRVSDRRGGPNGGACRTSPFPRGANSKARCEMATLKITTRTECHGGGISQ